MIENRPWLNFFSHVVLILGVAVGIYSAIRQYSVFDYSFTTISFLGFAMPTFWLALLLQILFVDIYLKWNVRIFYTSGLNNPHHGAWSLDRLQHLGLPIITLLIISFAGYSRYMRASMLDVLGQDYIRTAHAKGMPNRRVLFRHAARNALIPIATFLGPAVTGLLAGAVVIETIFNYPGVGKTLFEAATQRDYPVVMAATIYAAVATIFGYLLSDILYAWIDPRIRFN